MSLPLGTRVASRITLHSDDVPVVVAGFVVEVADDTLIVWLPQRPAGVTARLKVGEIDGGLLAVPVGGVSRESAEALALEELTEDVRRAVSLNVLLENRDDVFRGTSNRSGQVERADVR